jgi:GNAT superfamily N-acetyltransferase
VQGTTGTGVIPAKRGNKLSTQLHEYALPILHKNNIDKIVLEVITTNIAAIKIYKNIGFEITRQLNCFKGSISITNTNSGLEIHELKEYDWGKFHSFWDIELSWQNSSTAVEKLRQSNVSIGEYENEKLVGYTIYSPEIKRLQQLPVDKAYRKRAVGRQLLAYISTNMEKIFLLSILMTLQKKHSNLLQTQD